MTKEVTKNNKKYHICAECDFTYLDKKIAEKCERWCKKYHSCNVEITKHAVDL